MIYYHFKTNWNAGEGNLRYTGVTVCACVRIPSTHTHTCFFSLLLGRWCLCESICAILKNYCITMTTRQWKGRAANHTVWLLSHLLPCPSSVISNVYEHLDNSEPLVCRHPGCHSTECRCRSRATRLHMESTHSVKNAKLLKCLIWSKSKSQRAI